MKNIFTGKISKALVVTMLAFPTIELQSQSIVHASENTQYQQTTPVSSNVNTKTLGLIKSLSSNTINVANQHIKVEHNQFVLDNTAREVLSTTDISKITKILTIFNETVKHNNVLLTYGDEIDTSGEQESQITPYPFVSFARRHHYKAHIVGYGSNGYCYEDSRGHFHYIVTKTPFQTVTSVMGHGWGNAAGSGFGLGLIGK